MSKQTNYVTILQEGEHYRWQRVIGKERGTSTAIVDSFDRACEVAKAIAECNGIRFRKPVFV